MIVKAEGAAQAVGAKMLDEGAGKFVAVFEETLFELGGILEGTAIGHFSASIDHRVIADASYDLLMRAPLADGVVVVPGEAERIEVRVAGGAVRVVAMSFDFLAQGRFGALRRRGLDGRDVGWRRWWCFAENDLAEPHAAMHGAMAGAVGRESEHRAHCQQAATAIFELQRDTLKAASLGFRQSVEFAEPRIGHGPIGMDETIDGQVFGEHLAEELHRLQAHAVLQPRVVGWIELFVRREHAHAVKLQPLTREIFDEAARFAIREHAVHFLLQSIALERSAFGCGEERIVGHRAPQEIGKPRGEFRLGETLAGHGIALDEVNEVPRGQHTLQGHAIGIRQLLARITLLAI